MKTKVITLSNQKLPYTPVNQSELEDNKKNAGKRASASVKIGNRILGKKYKVTENHIESFIVRSI